MLPKGSTPFNLAYKLRVASHIDEITETSVKKDNQTYTDNKNHPFAKDGFTYRKAYFQDFDGKYYELTLSVGHNGTVATVYNIGKIKESDIPSAKIIAVVGSKPSSTSLSNTIIRNSAEKSTGKFPLLSSGDIAPENKGVKYSISQNLNSDLDAVLEGTFDASKNEVYIGETSNFMVKTIGATSLCLYMPASKAYSAMVTESEYKKNPYYSKQDHYHGMGKEDFMEILEKSETPLVAFAASSDEKGNSRRNRIVLVVDKKIKNLETGSYEYAVVVEEVDSNARVGGKRIKANKTITVYPRAKLYDDIQTAVADGRLLDITKKGEHLFAGGRGSNPQAAIQKDVLKKNIANFWANVKWKGEKTSSSSQKSTLSPVQKAFQKAGLLDQDGQLQYMQNDEKLTKKYRVLKLGVTSLH